MSGIKRALPPIPFDRERLNHQQQSLQGIDRIWYCSFRLADNLLERTTNEDFTSLPFAWRQSLLAVRSQAEPWERGGLADLLL
jgi:hypothetical protein